MYFDMPFISMLIMILLTITSMNLARERDSDADRVKEIFIVYWNTPRNL